MWERPERPDRDAKVPPRLFFGFQQRKQDHVADGFRAGEQHRKPVDPNPETAGRRHTVFKSEQKFLVDFLLLSAGLFEQTLTLLKRIVQLAVAWRDLGTVDDQFKNIDERSCLPRFVWLAARALSDNASQTADQSFYLR